MRNTKGTAFRSILPLWLLLAVLGCFALSACGGDSAQELIRQGSERMEQEDYKAAVIFLKNAVEKEETNLEARAKLAEAYLKLGKPDKAAAEYEVVIDKGAADSTIFAGYASSLLGMNKADEALDAAGKALDKATLAAEKAEAYQARGLAHLLKKDYDAARDALEAAYSNDPELIIPPLNLAHLAQLSGDQATADTYLQDVIKRHPDDTRAYHIMSQAALKRGDTDEAMALLQKITTIEPNDISAAYQIGKLSFENGDLDTMREKADWLKSRYPKQPHGYLLKGLWEYKNGNFDQASTDLSKSLTYGKSLLGEYYLGLAFMQLQKNDIALSHFLSVLEANPEHAPSRAMVAKIYTLQGLHDEAFIAATNAVKTDPNNSQAHLELGDGYLRRKEPQKAYDHYSKAAELNPGMAEPHVKKAFAAMQLGDMDTADAELAKYIGVNPDDLNARLIAFNLYLRAGQMDKGKRLLVDGLNGTERDALVYTILAQVSANFDRDLDATLDNLQKAQAANPKFPTPYYGQARLYAGQGDTAKAREVLLELLKITPDNPRALFEVASLHRLDDNDEQAEKYIQQALDTKDTTTRLRIINLYSDAGQVDKAMAIIDTMAAEDPDFYMANDLRGEVYQANKMYGKALESFQALDAKAANLSATRQVGVFLEQKNYDKAMEIAQKLVADHPTAPSVHYILASVHEAKGDYGQAITAVKHGLSIQGEDQQGWQYLGHLQFTGGDLQAAKATYDQIVEIAPESPIGYYGRGVLLEQQKQYQQAAREYALALQKDRNHVSSLNNLANLMLEQGGDRKLALYMAMRAYMQQPGTPNIADTMGMALLANGRYEDALPMLEDAAEKLSDNPTVLYHLGVAYAAMKENDKARDTLNKALAMDDFKEAAKARELLEKL